LRSLEEFRKNPHAQIPFKSPCRISQILVKFPNSLKFKNQFPFDFPLLFGPAGPFITLAKAAPTWAAVVTDARVVTKSVASDMGAVTDVRSWKLAWAADWCARLSKINFQIPKLHSNLQIQKGSFPLL
jgi:hypothetical protein